MTDDTVKIYVYNNKKFVEIEDTYFSKDSHHITFVNDNQIFKIENKKRKRDEYEDQTPLEQEYKKILKENLKTKEQITKIIKISHDIMAKSKKIVKEKEENDKYLKKTKMELLSARVQLEQYILEKNLAIEACNTMQKRIDELISKK